MFPTKRECCSMHISILSQHLLTIYLPALENCWIYSWLSALEKKILQTNTLYIVYNKTTKHNHIPFLYISWYCYQRSNVLNISYQFTSLYMHVHFTFHTNTNTHTHKNSKRKLSMGLRWKEYKCKKTHLLF